MSVIRIEHLRKCFGDKDVLKDINAEIEKGDVISLIGPSGTGKTTLLRCLIGLETVTDGKIYLYDQDITGNDKKAESLRLSMGMVFQNYNLFEHRTVIENVMMAPVQNLKISRQKAYAEAIQLLASAGLSGRELEYPSQLSGGQKQRVAIVRTMAMHQEILLVDEPTAALDPAMAREIGSMLRSLSRSGYTILMVTHDMELAKTISNRIFFMDEGVIYEQGTVDEIFNHPKRQKTYAYVQQLRSFRYNITSRNFDFYAFGAELAEFGSNSALSRRQQYALSFTAEELLMQSILPHLIKEPNISFSVSIPQNTKYIDVHIDYSGEEFNAMENCDEYASTLINHWAQESSFSFDGKNHLRIRLA